MEKISLDVGMCHICFNCVSFTINNILKLLFYRCMLRGFRLQSVLIGLGPPLLSLVTVVCFDVHVVLRGVGTNGSPSQLIYLAGSIL